MKLRSLSIALLTVAVALGVAACSETQLPQATGKGGIRGINAIVEFRNVNFLIEERSLDEVEFKGSTNRRQYDNLNYTFNFDLPQPNASARRLASLNVDVAADNDYTFVLAGSAANQQIFLWQRPVREWTEGETVFELNIGHANPDMGSVDVYFGAEGVVPVAGNAVGTLAYGDYLEAREFEAGDYQVTITPANDPGTILYRTAATAFTAAESYLLSVFKADPGITGPAGLRIFAANGAAAELADERFPPTVQFVNASLDTGAIDVVVDGDFANPAVGNLGFGEVSADIDIPATTADFQYLPAGTTTAVLEEEVTVAAGSRSLFVLAGETGAETTIKLPSTRRSFSNSARLRVINAVTNAEFVDFYLRAPGTDISGIFPNLFALQLGFNSQTEQVAGDYEVTITASGSKTPLAGPMPLTLDVTDVIELIILDTADPNVVDLLIYSNIDP